MYNEEEYLPLTVAAVRGVLEDMRADWELVIVDDASTDGTGAAADEAARAEPRVRVLHNPRNLTLGGSLRAAYALASKDLVLYTDADLPFDFQEVPRAVRLLEYQRADVLSAYRFHRTAEGPRRALYTFAYNELIRALFDLGVKDVNFSFKLFRRALLQRIELKSNGSFIDVEFLVRAKNAGAHIIQIGVDYFPRTRGVSTLSSWRVIGNILREMRQLRAELK
jgi:glycosyltransferase involved in cell wall biosynthesis